MLVLGMLVLDVKNGVLLENGVPLEDGVLLEEGEDVVLVMTEYTW